MRETTAVIYTRPTTPRGWGWETQTEGTTMCRRQEDLCRAYAARNGLKVDSVFVVPHDSPPLNGRQLHGIGHIIVSDAGVVPDLSVLCTLCATENVHLHVASENAAVTNWKPPR